MIFKLKKTNAITRYAIFTSPPSWDDLAMRISELFKFPLEDVIVTYVTNKEPVGLANDKELQNFYNSLQLEVDQIDKEIKFVVQDRENFDSITTITSTWSAGSNLSDLCNDGKVSLGCLDLNSPNPLLVEVENHQTVSKLKELIAKEMQYEFPHNTLNLWNVSSPIPSFELALRLQHIQCPQDIEGCTLLDPFDKLLEHFSSLPLKHIHIIVEHPSTETRKRCFTVSSPPLPGSSSTAFKRSSEHESIDNRSKKRLKGLTNECPLLDKMDKLYKQIQLLPDKPENYSDPKNVYQLPFPSVNATPRRFSLSDDETFSYMGRECFIKVWEEFLKVLFNPLYRQAIYVYGGKGFGKSHIFAALACLLIRQNYPVVYIPDCRGMLRNPLRYLVTAFRFAFISSPSIREHIERCDTYEDLADFCEDYRVGGGKLCFIVDQQNALDPEPLARDDVPNSMKVELMTLLQHLTDGHIEITSASANHKTFMHMAAKDTDEQKVPLMGGMSKSEMSCWWKCHNFTAFSLADKQRVEDLTGCIPLLLNPFVEHRHQTLESLEPEIWKHPRLASVLMETIDFAKAKKSELAQTNTFRDDFVLLMRDCLAGRQVGGSAPHIDHRYFYLDANGYGHYSCGLARQAMTEFLRTNAEEGVFLGPEWHRTLEIFKDNPSVISFTIEQMVISRITASGIQSEFCLPPAKTITFPGGITWLSKHEGHAYYVPIRFNQKAIDLLFVSVDQATNSAHVVGIQITVAKNHKDSETAFYADRDQWLIGLEGLDVKMSFIWIHDGARGKAEVKKQLKELRGREVVTRPDYTTYWVSIDQVDADLARTLARIRQV